MTPTEAHGLLDGHRHSKRHHGEPLWRLINEVEPEAVEELWHAARVHVRSGGDL